MPGDHAPGLYLTAMRAASRTRPVLRPRRPRRSGGAFGAAADGLVRVASRLRAARRIGLFALWTVLACTVQAVLVRLPGSAKVGFARAFWAGTCALIGLRIRVLGAPATQDQPGGHGRRGVVYAANHASWLDILVLGGLLRACFVSKAEVGRWPGVGTIARLGRTVFVSRTRAGTGRERDGMLGRLRGGDDLILFPEGTSSDGTRVLPFRSSFFSLAEGADPPLVQPVSLAYDRLGGLPALRADRARFAWYGDMDLWPHVWGLLQRRSFGVTVLLHPPLDPRDFPSRKALARACGERVAAGAAALRRQRRDVPVAGVPAAEQAAVFA
jgi:lyso-ornithine lipid O-acyltransferase